MSALKKIESWIARTISILAILFVSIFANVKSANATIIIADIQNATSSFSFHIEIPKTVFKISGNVLTHCCQNGQNLVDYRDKGEGVKTVAAKGGSQLLLKPGAANLTQKGLDHIVARHWFTSGAKGAGKFAEGTTGAGLKSMINTTTTQGVFRANTMGRAGTIAEYNFGRAIGTTSSGAPASSLRVVIGTNGNVITAFPF